VLDAGIRAELTTKSTGLAASKRVLMAEALRLRGDTAAAIKEAQAALSAGEADDVRVTGALTLARAGRHADAHAIAKQLDTSLESDPRAYAALVRAEIALAQGDARAAVDHGRAAENLANTWMGHVILGRAYLAAHAFAEAYAHFETALKRKGEAAAVFLDDRPTLHLLPPVYYYMGLAQEGLKSPGAVESFKTFLAMKQHGDEQGMVADARRRVSTP
jgi:tetratricopeptide (TPR) repeat protein